MNVLLRIIALPVLLYGGLGAISSMITGDWFMFCVFAGFMFVYFSFAEWISSRTQSKFSRLVSARGLRPDFIYQYGGQGLVIDLAARKLLVGRARTGAIINFSSVTEFFTSDVHKGSNVYIKEINVRTNDFHNPLMTVTFENEPLRNMAYAKLHSAFNC